MKKIITACLLLIPSLGMASNMGPEQIDSAISSVCQAHPKKEGCLFLVKSIVVMTATSSDVFASCEKLREAGGDPSTKQECKDASNTRDYLNKLYEQITSP